MQLLDLELEPKETIRAIMLRMELKNRALAKLIAIDEQSLSKMLNGSRTLTDGTLAKMAKVLGLSFELLKYGEGLEQVLPTLQPLDPFKTDEEATESGPPSFENPPVPRPPFKIEAVPIELNPDGEVSKNWRGSEFVDLPNGMVMMSVPLVDQYAYAGYLSGWKDPEFLHDLPKFSFIAQKRHSGKYTAFEVRGDSMDDNTRDAICEGDEVLGREIERQFWNSKFHLHRFEDYVIVHQDGIITKRIVAHDVESGIITCISTNPNKDLYPDILIRLEEVYELYNIVKVSRDRRRR